LDQGNERTRDEAALPQMPLLAGVKREGRMPDASAVTDGSNAGISAFPLRTGSPVP